MSDKIKENEEIETKKLESIPGENDLPDVKSKEYYEKLVIERRLNSYEKSKNAQETSSSEDAQEVSTEDLNDVAGGTDYTTLEMYGLPSRPLTLREWEKIWKEEKERKEKEKKHEEKVKQGLSIGVEQDNLTR